MFCEMLKNFRLLILILGGIILIISVVILFWFFKPKINSYSFFLPRFYQSDDSHFLVAHYASLKKDVAISAVYLEKLYKNDTHNRQIAEQLLEIYLYRGQWKKVVNLANHLSPIVPKNSQMRLARMIDAMKKGHFDDAMVELRYIDSSPFIDLIRSVCSMWIEYGKGHPKKAREYADQLEEKSIFISLISHNVARMREQIGDIEGAQNSYLRALKNGGINSQEFLLDYTEFLHRHEQTEQARLLLTQYPNQDVNHPLIEASYKQLGLQPNVLKTLSSQRGFAQFMTGLMEQFSLHLSSDMTIPYIQMALWLDSSLMRSYLLLGKLYVKDKFYEEAIIAYNYISKSSPYYEPAQIALAHIYEQNHDIEQSVAIFQDLLALRRKAYIQVFFADMYRRNEQLESAEMIYDMVLAGQNLPVLQDWHVYFSRSIVKESLGKKKQAEEDLLKAYELSNNHPVILNYLGYYWIDQGVQLQKGLHLIQTAVKKNPNNGFFVDSLGWAYYRLGDFEKAVLFLERATELQPNESEIAHHLGDSLWKIGRKFEARYQWKRASDVESDAILRQIILDKIDDGIS